MANREHHDAAPYRVPWKSALAIIVGVLAMAAIAALGPGDLGQRSSEMLEDFGFDPDVVRTVNSLAEDRDCEQLDETLDEVLDEAASNEAEGRDVDGFVVHIELARRDAGC